MPAPSVVAHSAVGYSAMSAQSWNVSMLVSGVNTGILVNIIGAQPQTIAPTYNGVALSLLDSHQNVGQGMYYTLWGLVNPAAGTHTLHIVLDDDGSSKQTGGYAAFTIQDMAQSSSFTGIVHQSGTGTSDDLAVTSSVGALVLDMIHLYPAPTCDASQTQIDKTGGATYYVGTSSKAGAASTSMKWTWTGSNTCNHIGVSVNPVAAAGPTESQLTGAGAGFPGASSC